MSESDVKKISGHKDDRSFRRYVEMGNSYLSKAKDKLSKDKVDAMINMLEGNKQRKSKKVFFFKIFSILPFYNIL